MANKPDYEKMMQEKPMVMVTASTKLKRGQLFGFKALGDDRITAAYPCYCQTGNEIVFVLYVRPDGRPCLDNDWIREDRDQMYTNEDPIIVDMPGVETKPTTFQGELKEFFNGTKS